MIQDLLGSCNLVLIHSPYASMISHQDTDFDRLLVKFSNNGIIISLISNKEEEEIANWAEQLNADRYQRQFKMVVRHCLAGKENSESNNKFNQAKLLRYVLINIYIC